MNMFTIIWRMIKAQGARHTITVLIIALGMGLMLSSASVMDSTKKAMSSTATRYPMVVGGEIGSVTLVLGSISRLQDLEAGLDSSVYKDLKADPRVEIAVPLIAGHAVEGHALLGTSEAYFLPRSKFQLKDGRYFEENADEVVMGADAAAALGMGVGDEVKVEHQHAGHYGEHTLKVVGVLQFMGNDNDQTVFCPIDAIHHSHGVSKKDEDHTNHHEEHDKEHHVHKHHDKISSILIKPVDNNALLDLQESLEPKEGIQVALTGQTLSRLMEQLSGGGQLISLMVSGIVLMTFLSLLLSIYNTTSSQSKELAVMRVLGATRGQVGFVVFGVTGFLSLSGLLGGIGIAWMSGFLAEKIIRNDLGLDATVTLFTSGVTTWLIAALVVLIIVGIQPAIIAYHSQPAEGLKGNQKGTVSYLRWTMRFLIPLAVFIWAEQMMALHDDEAVSKPLDPASAQIFTTVTNWTIGSAPQEVLDLDGKNLEITGYMYTLGDPFVTNEFYLVSINPRLARCPFCYRAPTRHERIKVVLPQEVDVAPGMIKVTGVMKIQPDESDIYLINGNNFEVIVE